MPARTPAPAPEGTEQFVVTAAAVTLTVGRKRDGKLRVARIGKGKIINAPADHPSIQSFLANRTIARYVPGKSVKPATARLVAKASGAEDDPVAVPMESVQPMTPVNGVAVNPALDTLE